MNSKTIVNYHITVGENVAGDKVLIYLVDEDFKSKNIFWSITNHDIIIIFDKKTVRLKSISSCLIATLKVYKNFKIMNTETEQITETKHFSHALIKN